MSNSIPIQNSSSFFLRPISISASRKAKKNVLDHALSMNVSQTFGIGIVGFSLGKTFYDYLKGNEVSILSHMLTGALGFLGTTLTFLATFARFTNKSLISDLMRTAISNVHDKFESAGPASYTPEKASKFKESVLNLSALATQAHEEAKNASTNEFREYSPEATTTEDNSSPDIIALNVVKNLFRNDPNNTFISELRSLTQGINEHLNPRGLNLKVFFKNNLVMVNIESTDTYSEGVHREKAYQPFLCIPVTSSIFLNALSPKNVAAFKNINPDGPLTTASTDDELHSPQYKLDHSVTNAFKTLLANLALPNPRTFLEALFPPENNLLVGSREIVDGRPIPVNYTKAKFHRLSSIIPNEHRDWIDNLITPDIIDSTDEASDSSPTTSPVNDTSSDSTEDVTIDITSGVGSSQGTLSNHLQSLGIKLNKDDHLDIVTLKFILLKAAIDKAYITSKATLKDKVKTRNMALYALKIENVNAYNKMYSVLELAPEKPETMNLSKLDLYEPSLTRNIPEKLLANPEIFSTVFKEARDANPEVTFNKIAHALKALSINDAAYQRSLKAFSVGWHTWNVRTSIKSDVMDESVNKPTTISNFDSGLDKGESNSINRQEAAMTSLKTALAYLGIHDGAVNTPERILAQCFYRAYLATVPSIYDTEGKAKLERTSFLRRGLSEAAQNTTSEAFLMRDNKLPESAYMTINDHDTVLVSTLNSFLSLQNEKRAERQARFMAEISDNASADVKNTLYGIGIASKDGNLTRVVISENDTSNVRQQFPGKDAIARILEEILKLEDKATKEIEAKYKSIDQNNPGVSDYLKTNNLEAKVKGRTLTQADIDAVKESSLASKRTLAEELQEILKLQEEVKAKTDEKYKPISQSCEADSRIKDILTTNQIAKKVKERTLAQADIDAVKDAIPRILDEILKLEDKARRDIETKYKSIAQNKPGVSDYLKTNNLEAKVKGRTLTQADIDAVKESSLGNKNILAEQLQEILKLQEEVKAKTDEKYKPISQSCEADSSIRDILTTNQIAKKVKERTLAQTDIDAVKNLLTTSNTLVDKLKAILELQKTHEEELKAAYEKWASGNKPAAKRLEGVCYGIGNKISELRLESDDILRVKNEFAKSNGKVNIALILKMAGIDDQRTFDNELKLERLLSVLGTRQANEIRSAYKDHLAQLAREKEVGELKAEGNAGTGSSSTSTPAGTTT